jgi:hypothetical protein
LALQADRLRQQRHVLADAQHAVGESAFAELHRARQAPDQLEARVVQLVGARGDLLLERAALVHQRQVVLHAQHGDRRADRLGDVVHRARHQAARLVLGIGSAR